MKPMSKVAAKILNRLADGLLPLCEDGAKARRVGEPGGCYMQVVVERLDERTVSVAHYYSQNGDPMRDPEMLFVSAPDGQGGTLWYATYYRQDGMGIEQESATFNAETGGFLARPRLQADHARFANGWMANIKAQHPEFFSARR